MCQWGRRQKVGYSAIKPYPFSRAMDSPLSTESPTAGALSSNRRDSAGSLCYGPGYFTAKKQKDSLPLPASAVYPRTIGHADPYRKSQQPLRQSDLHDIPSASICNVGRMVHQPARANSPQTKNFPGNHSRGDSSMVGAGHSACPKDGRRPTISPVSPVPASLYGTPRE